MPMVQNRLPMPGGRMLATRAVVVLPPGKSSIRTHEPGVRGREERRPQPQGFTNKVWHNSEKGSDGSRLVTRKGICARTRVPCRLCREIAP